MFERRFPHTHFTLDQLSEMFRPVSHSIDSVSLMDGGAVNTNYRIDVGGESFVIRHYARGKEACRHEKKMWELVHKEISVPELLFCDEKSYSIFRFVEGEKPGGDHSYALGETLARIHSFTFEEAGLSDGTVFPKGSSPYFDEAYRILTTCDRVKQRLGQPLLDQVVQFIVDHKGAFPVIDDIVLVHSDYRPDNLLFGEGLTVLDWEYAHRGSRMMDIAILMGGRNPEIDPKAFVEGYGHLPDDWQRIAAITDLVNISQLLDREHDSPNFFARLKSVVEKTVMPKAGLEPAPCCQE